MPGMGKTKSLAIACVMTAAVAQRRVIYATVSNEPVRSLTACLDELLSDAHEVARAAFRRIPADEKAKTPQSWTLSAMYPHLTHSPTS